VSFPDKKGRSFFLYYFVILCEFDMDVLGIDVVHFIFLQQCKIGSSSVLLV
jgi:hypothetical protein